MAEIKKVVQRLYEFNLKNANLEDGAEMISTDRGNEFVNAFIRRDLDKGVLVTPSGYSKGLIYKTTDNGTIYNNPSWMPDIVKFKFNIYGLKKGSYYRLIVKAKNFRKYNSLTDVTDDRTLEVSNDLEELVIKEDLSENLAYKDCEFIFKAASVEENFYFRLGKIAINNILIDEVELVKDIEEVINTEPTVELDDGKSNIVGYGVFSSDIVNDNNQKINVELSRLTGKGLNLYYNKKTNEYSLERDNYEDTIGAAFTGANYLVDFNFNKAPFVSYVITDISSGPSPNTLKQGYLTFKTLVNGVEKFYDGKGRLSFVVRKIM